MSRLIAFDWEADYLAGVEADVSATSIHVRRCFRYEWPGDSAGGQNPPELGKWLADSLRADGMTPGEARVVLPREAIVVRTLDLPKVPENELPDLVRFQAATRSSTPLDRLALDFLPLPVDDDDAAQQVLLVTVDAERLRHVQGTLVAAGIELSAVGISPVTVGELVTRIDGEHSTGPNQATLLIFQDARRVEITILIQQRVIFSHHSRLAGSGDAAGLRASLAEVNRSVVALSQAQSDLQIAEVCLIHAGDADPAFESALADRFGGRLHVLDVARASGIHLGRPADRATLASYAPALGALLQASEQRVPAIDFLAPRRAVIPPDRRKLKFGMAVAAAMVLLGSGYWAFSAYLAELTSETDRLTAQIVELDSELLRGQPDLNAAGLIGAWSAASRDPLAVLDRLDRLAPGTDRIYFRELSMLTERRDNSFRLKGTGYAIEQADVRQLQEVLETAGLRVNPVVGGQSRFDPDYPFEFELDVELPVSPPEDSAPSPNAVVKVTQR